MPRVGKVMIALSWPLGRPRQQLEGALAHSETTTAANEATTATTTITTVIIIGATISARVANTR
jgi:hypothetical protein